MRHNHRAMHFGKIFKAIGPIAMMAAIGAGVKVAKRTKGSDWSGKFHFNGKEGVKLDALDLGGEPPHALVVFGPDQIIITQGEEFAISAQGPEAAREALRFVREDNCLFILRDSAACGEGGELATVNVTMPALQSVTLAGSGTITCNALADKAKLVLAGSGRLRAQGIDIARLDVTIAGSGHLEASGAAKHLSLTIAGSGVTEMALLLVEQAEIDIAGSGHSIFACDGEVSANIMVRAWSPCAVRRAARSARWARAAWCASRAQTRKTSRAGRRQRRASAIIHCTFRIGGPLSRQSCVIRTSRCAFLPCLPPLPRRCCWGAASAPSPAWSRLRCG